MSSEQFTVRRLQTAEEVATIVSKAAAMGWKPGALDHVSYFAVDNTGFFVGELDGKAICCVSAVKYSDEYAFFGHYIVEEPYRGRGYGLAAFRAALSSLPEGCNMAADVREDEVQMYERVYGAKPTWKNQYVTIAAAQGSLALADVINPPGTIRPATDIQFSDLLQYDTSIHVCSRSSFLEKWISAPNCYAYAATNNDGTVVGYIVVRTILGREDEWRIGPLFADNSIIAKGLYKRVFDKVAAKDPTATIVVDVPFGDLPNREALEIIKELPSTLSDTIITRMYKYGVPSGLQLQKIFALTSSSI